VAGFGQAGWVVAEEYAWAIATHALSLDFCLTFVRGLEPDEVIARLGGADPVTIVGGAAGFRTTPACSKPRCSCLPLAGGSCCAMPRGRRHSRRGPARVALGGIRRVGVAAWVWQSGPGA
jgi:hypothetical protein